MVLICVGTETVRHMEANTNNTRVDDPVRIRPVLVCYLNSLIYLRVALAEQSIMFEYIACNLVNISSASSLQRDGSKQHSQVATHLSPFEYLETSPSIII